MVSAAYYQDDHVTIYHGDARDVLPMLTFDVIVTDPPYGINFAGYNHGKVQGDTDDEAARWLLANTSPMVVFGVNHFPEYLPSRGAWSCWDKRTNENADKMFGSPFEMIWVSGKDRPGKIYRIMHGGVVNADGGGVKRDHPTQKPVTLMVRIIGDWATSGVIADPFMGSGTTLRAAKDLGRQAIGIEVDERYCEIAAKRMGQEVLF